MQLQPRVFAVLEPISQTGRSSSRSPSNSRVPAPISIDGNRLVFQRPTDASPKIFTFDGCLPRPDQALHLTRLRKSRLTIICGGSNSCRQPVFESLLSNTLLKLQQPALRLTNI